MACCRDGGPEICRLCEANDFCKSRVSVSNGSTICLTHSQVKNSNYSVHVRLSSGPLKDGQDPRVVIFYSRLPRQSRASFVAIPSAGISR